METLGKKAWNLRRDEGLLLRGRLKCIGEPPCRRRCGYRCEGRAADAHDNIGFLGCVPHVRKSGTMDM